MNLYSSACETLRLFIERHRASGTVEKRTYVFIFVPFDPRKNGHAIKADIVSGDEQQPNYDLMWTLFLPNPLWPPKERK